MIAGIKKAFIENLPHVEWMDGETKDKALDKVNSNHSTNLTLGFPHVKLLRHTTGHYKRKKLL